MYKFKYYVQLDYKIVKNNNKDIFMTDITNYYHKNIIYKILI